MSTLTARLVAGAFFLASALAVHAGDIPYLSGRVVDDAEILSSAARNRLTATLRAHEQRTTNQIAVLTVPTIHGESIEEYALAVFEQWKLGQRDKDNGVLLVRRGVPVQAASRGAAAGRAGAEARAAGRPPGVAIRLSSAFPGTLS